MITPSLRFMRAALIVPALMACVSAASAQTLEIRPSYHPNGPTLTGGNRIEFYSDEPFLLETNLPGMNHAQSQAATADWATFLAVSFSILPAPIPVGPFADIWIDVNTVTLVNMPPGLEIPFQLSIAPSTTAIEIAAQVASFDLTDPGLALHTSIPYELSIMPKEPTYPDRMVPAGSLAPGQEAVFYHIGNNEYHLRHTAGSMVTEYVLDLEDNDFMRGALSMRELASGVNVLHRGGVSYAQGLGVNLFKAAAFMNFGTHTLVDHGITGKTVWFHWRDVLPKLGGGGTVTRERRHEFTLSGRSVEVHVYALNPTMQAADNYFGFNIGGVTHAGGSSAIERVRIPYMDQIGVSHINSDWYHSTYTDLFQSNASFHTAATIGNIPGGVRYSEVMVYQPNDDFSNNKLDESSWVTISRDVNDLFVASTAPPSIHGEDLQGKVGITLSIENKNPSAYALDLAAMGRMREWMFDELYLFKFHWMAFGTNRRAPTHTPPDTKGGTDSQFRQIITDAVSEGWLVALYTDFFSLDQAQGSDDNPQYSETPGSEIFFESALKDQTGNFRKGYNSKEDNGSGHAGTPYTTRIMAPRRAQYQAEREAKIMVDDLGVNSAYFDVMTISAPDLIATSLGTNIGGTISQESKSPNDQTISGAIAAYKNLFARSSARTGGPAVGEGSFGTYESRFDTFYAGYLDGTYRTLSSIEQDGSSTKAPENLPVIVDYELEVNHNRMFGFGMGQYGRFFDENQPFTIPILDDRLNKLRATQISYGHNGYVLTASTANPKQEFLTRAQIIKEYYTMQSLSAEWAGATVTNIQYRQATSGAPWLTLTEALNLGTFEFKKPVIKVQWSNGLDIIINHGDQNVGALGHTLPPLGWIALNPATGYENKSVIDSVTGTRVDIVRCADYEMADGNGVSFTPGGVLGTTLDLKVVNIKHGKTIIEEPNTKIVVN